MLDGSYDEIYQSKLMVKYLPQLLGQIELPALPLEILAETDLELRRAHWNSRLLQLYPPTPANSATKNATG